MVWEISLGILSDGFRIEAVEQEGIRVVAIVSHGKILVNLLRIRTLTDIGDTINTVVSAYITDASYTFALIGFFQAGPGF